MVVDSTQRQAPDGPIGVVAAFATGFDRVASRPLLLLPPLALDLVLWLGPRVSIKPMVEGLLAQLTVPVAAEETLQEQVELFRQGLQVVAEHFNLLTALSSLPAGVPSLMAGTRPESSPLGGNGGLELGDPGAILLAWLLLTAIGIALGAVYHRALARATAPNAELPSSLWSWGRLLLLALMAYIGLLVAAAIAFLVASVAAFILPLLGVGVSFVAFSLLFWLLVYLVFTPHGIVRYRFGVLRAMMESALVVRWNFLATVGFLALAVILSWLTNMVWALPASSSWYGMLSIVGHAFVSGMLLTSSYAFYQGRREWLLRTREHLRARIDTFERFGQGAKRDVEEGEH